MDMVDASVKVFVQYNGLTVVPDTMGWRCENRSVVLRTLSYTCPGEEASTSAPINRGVKG